MTETVLTDEQIARAVGDAGHEYVYWLEYRPAVDGRCVHEIARAIESAILQSPKIVAMRKDAARYRYLRNEAWGAGKHKPNDMHVVLIAPHTYKGNLTELAEDALDEAVDAAMEAKS